MANIALIALLVPLKSLILFFAICLVFVMLRSVLSGPVRTAVQVSGVVIVTLLLLYLKKSDLLFNHLVNSWLMAIVPRAATGSSTELVASLGISYGLLRFVYALFDKAVTPWQFVRYYFFFPAASWALTQGVVRLSWMFFFPFGQSGFQPKIAALYLQLPLEHLQDASPGD